MKKLAFYALVTALLTACGPRSTISGYIEGLTNDTIVVRSLTLPNNTIRTDTLIAHNGVLRYETPSDSAAIYTIMPLQGTHEIDGGTRRFNNCSNITIFRFDGERVKFDARLDSLFVTHLDVRGSQINSDWSEIYNATSSLHIDMAKLQFGYMPNDEFEAAYTPLNNKYKAYIQEYIASHPNNHISAYILSAAGTLAERVHYAEMISDEVRNSHFAPIFENIEMAIERQRIADNCKEGAVAPDFTLNDSNGNPFTLTTLRGKWVVLDFWGSWCMPCVKGMPEMKKAYDKCRGKVEFVGIACNDKESNWRATIERQALPWIQTFNPRNNDYHQDPLVLYNIKAFPTKIILTPEGKIHKIFVGETPEFYKELEKVIK